MTVGLVTGSIVAKPGQALSLSSLFTVTPGAGNPQFLIVSGLDRNEYTTSAHGSTGTLSGNGKTASFSSLGSDSLGVGIVFTYNATTGQYTNATYGNLANVVLTASQDTNRNESISLFATNNASMLTQYAANPYALSQFTTYVGSVSVVTQPSFAGPTPSQATPNSICSVAMSFVGQTWNNEGCWVLASNISAEAGASLPLTSTSLGIAGKANGEWIVAYNGPAGQGGAWQSLVKAGEMVVFETSLTSGHITTVVSGAGASAMLVDNVTYVNANGSYANAAHDGSANDIIIAAPHLASQEFASAISQSVVIYELDTPTVTAASPYAASVTLGGTLAVSSLFTTSDPASRTISEYQLYDTGTQGAASDTFLVNGAVQTAHSAATAITETAAALANTLLRAATSVGVDTIDVRAFNGSYWGDWQTLTVNLVAAPIVTLAAQTAAQTWRQGLSVSFSLGANTFADSQHQALSYTATLSNGAPLPSWLRFNAATETFSGVVPNTAAGLSIKVTATDTSGVSASETFAVSTPAQAPLLTAPTASQLWLTNQAVNFRLAANTFTDPQGDGLTYSANQVGSGSATSWLRFNAATETFSGTAPAGTNGTIQLEVVAKNTAGLSTVETFNVTMATTAAQFSQAISALSLSSAANTVASSAPPPANMLHALSSPVA